MFHNPFYGNAGWGNTDTSSSSEESSTQHEKLKASLKPGWSLNLNKDGRIIYYNHASQTSSWLPPAENWDSYKLGMPYGWETAVDKDGKYYFINHLNKTTTYEDPRLDITEEPPQPRDVELIRDVSMGFGFVAGSEKPVIVRFVTEGGPSEGKLLPGDQVWKINGEDVRKAPRDHVIQLVRCSQDTVHLTVCQPPLDNSNRKSALLSAAKKAKLKNHPSRVRFAEGVVISSPPEFNPSNIGNNESCIPFMPNVLKVFLENGQTKSFKYDSTTIVQDVLKSLQEKLSIQRMEHFSLVVEHTKSVRRNKMTLLDPKESLARIAAKPGAQHLRCLFRVTFMPKDAYELLKSDPVAFEYFYVQSCNDVVYERFAPELKYDIALKLAALHIQQHGLNNKTQGKLTIKNVEKEFGLEKFVPLSLIETMKRKELRKLLSHFLKLHQNNQKQQSPLTLKLQYLKIISELPSYGAKCFPITMKDSSTENVLLIGPKYGISLISSLRSGMPSELCDLETLTSVKVCREDEVTHRVELRLKDPDRECLVLYLEDRDAEELLLVLHGYYRLFVNKSLIVEQEKEKWTEDSAPPYHTLHKVTPASWSYIQTSELDLSLETEKLVDLAMAPPYKPQSNFSVQTLPSNGHLKMSETRSIGNQNYSTVDRNMNRTNQKMDPANYRNNNRTSKNVNNNSSANLDSVPSDKLGFDIPSVVSMEILEQDVDVNEAKNEEVIKRVVQMTKLVQDAEHYLTDQEEENGDSTDPSDTQSVKSEYSRTESECSGSFPRIKHSDSLLLLTQGQRQVSEAVSNVVKTMDLTDHDPSESDTDSLGTPHNSPSHRALHVDRTKLNMSLQPPIEMKHSGSSFGLHSPDGFPEGIPDDDPSVQELIQRLKEDSFLPCAFAEGTLVLDPDIIDLTMIPPPITPDDDGVKYLPNIPSMPPTPFADRLTLEAELKTFQNDLGELRDLANWTNDAYADGHSFSVYSSSSSNFAAVSDSEDTLSQSSFNTSVLSYDSTLYIGDQVVDSDRSSVWSQEIDSFIANVTVPPPPTEEAIAKPRDHSPVTELTQDQISAFIIPPPPDSAYDSSDKADTVCNSRNITAEDRGVERDRAVGEVKIASEKMSLDLNPVSSEHVLTIAERKERLRNALNSNGPIVEPFSLSDLQMDSKRPPDYPPPPPPRYSQTLGRVHSQDARVLRDTPLLKSSSQNDISENSIISLDNLNSQLVSQGGPSSTSIQSSSNDSISSSASIITVKSKSPPLAVDTTEIEGPPLPPKKSPTKTTVKPPIPPPSGQGTYKSMKESPPSPKREPGSPKPALPSRLRKPNTSPVKVINPKTKQPISPPSNSLGATGKPAAPPPSAADSLKSPTSPRKHSFEATSPPTSPQKISSKNSIRNHSPTESPNSSCPPSPSMFRSGSKLPRPKDGLNRSPHHSPLNGKVSFSPPQTSSPRLNLKLNGTKMENKNGLNKTLMNGLASIDLNDSIESIEFEQDSLESSFEVESQPKESPFVSGDKRMNHLLKHLDMVIASDSSHQNGTHNPHMDQEKYLTAKDLLTSESRQFVTASKLFVKSATESEVQLLENLELCLQMMERIMHVTELALTYTPVPVQTLGVADKVRCVGVAYRKTLIAASSAVGKDMSDRSMLLLMEEATHLATVLTTLVRTLKVAKS